MKRNRHTDVESTSPYRITWIPLKTIRIYENFVFFLVLFLNSFAHPIDFILFCADRQPIDSCEHRFSYDRLQIVCCYFRVFFVRSFSLFCSGWMIQPPIFGMTFEGCFVSTLSFFFWEHRSMCIKCFGKKKLQQSDLTNTFGLLKRNHFRWVSILFFLQFIRRSFNA